MRKTAVTAALVAALFVAAPVAAQETDAAVVPDSIVEAIKASAAEEWPDDYAMQRHVLETESAAYLWIVGYEAPEGVPDDVAERIRAKAAEEWPHQYTMQKYVIEQQVAAYLELQ